MNYMKQIAEMLELEWDDDKGECEVFDFGSRNFNGYCNEEIKDMKITNNGLSINPSTTSYRLLNEILSGQLDIKKLPKKWKPKYGEAYYVPCLDCIGFKREIYVGVDTWQIKNGLYYQTQAEADAETNRILKLREDEQK